MSKLSGKAMLGIAATLSLLTAALVYHYLQQAAGVTNNDMLPVIIAKVDIAPKTRITADMLQVAKVPAKYRQPGAIEDANEVIGVLARERVVAGEQITNRRLFPEGKSGGFTGIIPIGKRAVTVGVTEITGVAGFIKPGDSVDVAVTFDATTAGDYIGDVLIKNVMVLAVNHDIAADTASSDKEKDKKEPLKTATVTLAVNAIDVHYLAVADDRGKIRLALRPLLEEPGYTFTRSVTARELMGRLPVSEKPISPPAEPVSSRQETWGREERYTKPSVDTNSAASGKRISIIRGTQVETIPVN